MRFEVQILVCVSLLAINLNFHGSISLTRHQSIQERDPPLHFRLICASGLDSSDHGYSLVAEVCIRLKNYFILRQNELYQY